MVECSTSRTREEPTPCPISVRIAVSGFIGVVVSMVTLFIIATVAGRMELTTSFALIVLQILAAIVIFLPLTLPITGPLILIAIVCGVLLQRTIERHLLPWSVAAPIIVWLFVCVAEALMRQNQYFATHGFLDRLAVTIRARDNLLFLFGAFVSGVVFYVLSAPRSRRSA